MGSAKKTKAYFEQTEHWVKVDQEGNVIGEPQEVNVLVKEVTRSGFMITYLADLVAMIDTIGNKKMKVVRYILSHMDSNNKLTETEAEIAVHCGVSRATVNETLRLLTDVHFIARKYGTIMLSPRIAHRGNAKREHYLMTKFYELDMNMKGEGNDTVNEGSAAGI